LIFNSSMYIISYDFANNKRRARFARFLKRYGRRIQYSVFEIKNSPRVLANIMCEIKLKYAPHFTTADSIVMIDICEACRKKIEKFGFSANEEEPVIIFE
jgi:CRISPR-associated protein Cas2